MQNTDVNMTKDTYFEMCTMLGEEPIDSEIPLDMSDFPPLVQQCFLVYRILPDMWDSMDGTYRGKDYSLVFSLFKVYSIDSEEVVLCLDILQHIDSVRINTIKAKIKAKSPGP